VDILVKPLSDGGAAISFINVSERKQTSDFSITASDIPFASFIKGDKYKVTNLWTGEEWDTNEQVFKVSELAACDCYTIKIKAC
jgi:alpha-galactosidase